MTNNLPNDKAPNPGVPGFDVAMNAAMQEIRKLREQIYQCYENGDDAKVKELSEAMYRLMTEHGLGEEGVGGEEIE